MLLQLLDLTDFVLLLLGRPPYSLGLFTLVQAQAITQWFLRTYYMHYKLFQYAFTNRFALLFTISADLDWRLPGWTVISSVMSLQGILQCVFSSSRRCS